MIVGSSMRRRPAMINPVECRQHAVDCQRMAERAPNLRVKSILIDISRTWQRLALEVGGAEGRTTVALTVNDCRQEPDHDLRPKD